VQAEDRVTDSLEIVGLSVRVRASQERILSDVNFSLRPGEGLGLTGESGSGKTTLCLALAGLLHEGLEVEALRVRGPVPLARWAGSGQPRTTHACEVGKPRLFCLFQEPKASLNPYRKIGSQLRTAWLTGRKESGRASESIAAGVRIGKARVVSAAKQQADRDRGWRQAVNAALEAVGLGPDVSSAFAHQLSTGMCQRVLLAMADLVGCNVLIADEPFVSVDAGTRCVLTRRIREWKQTRRLMLVLASHDVELLRELTDRIMVLYAGHVAEYGPSDEVLGLSSSKHPYTELICRLHTRQDRRELYKHIWHRPKGRTAQCVFAPRCYRADDQLCVERLPQVSELPSGSPASRARGRVIRCSLIAGRNQVLPSNAGSGPSSDADKQEQEPLSQDTRRADSDRQSRHQASAREYSGGHIQAHSGRQKHDTVDRFEDEAIGGTCGAYGADSAFVAVRNLRIGYKRRRWSRRWQVVLSDVNLTISEGERLGLLGPNGSGKTTLARAMVGLIRPLDGFIRYLVKQLRLDPPSSRTKVGCDSPKSAAKVAAGGCTTAVELARDRGKACAELHRLVQLVHQDADLAMDPATRAVDAIAEGYLVYERQLDRATARSWATALAAQFGLTESVLARRPRALSGGERRRVVIAQALAAFGCPVACSEQPRLLILDEPTSGLDIVLQEQLAQVLEWAQEKMNLAILTLTHDARFARRFCTRLVCIKDGRIEPCPV